MNDQELRIMAVVKENQKYIFRFARGEEMGLLKAMVDYAKDNRFNIDWHDVFLFVRKLRQRAQKEMT